MIQLMIMKQLDYKMLIRLGSTCRYLRVLMFDITLWKNCELNFLHGNFVFDIRMLGMLNRLPIDAIKSIRCCKPLTEDLRFLRFVAERNPSLERLALSPIVKDFDVNLFKHVKSIVLYCNNRDNCLDQLVRVYSHNQLRDLTFKTLKGLDDTNQKLLQKLIRNNCESLESLELTCDLDDLTAISMVFRPTFRFFPAKRH